MLIEIEPPMPAPGPFDSIYRHTLYRNMLAAVEDLGAAWHNVIDDNVDVGDPADRHIAAARLLRMLCSRHRRIYGHALPVTVLPCSVAVLHNCVDIRWDDGDHLLLVTGRAVADLGLAARCPITPIPTLVIERPLGWADTAEFLMVRTDDVTITYVAHDRHTYRRNELWRRTNAAWGDVAERVQREYDRLFAERLRRDWEGGRPRTGPELAASYEARQPG